MFVRAVIQSFTRPGDLVLDPYVGGGTSLVEAIALGRHAIGVDISELAEFVASVKTTIYKERELDCLREWATRLPKIVNVHRSSKYFEKYADEGYYKHLEDASRWRLRKAIEQALGSAIRLKSERLVSFGRCVVLRTGQWALDGRSWLPSVADFREMLMENAVHMIGGAHELRAAVETHTLPVRVQVINRSAAGLENDRALALRQPPQLVVTSPPYPGVHVLYHRWQVDGRKETPAPFWIANKLDGAGSSYYTMGDRKFPDLASYFANVSETMSSVASLCDRDTIIVQMVAFSDPSWQLKRYLQTMRDVGLSEAFLSSLEGKRDGRLWRTVPNSALVF